MTTRTLAPASALAALLSAAACAAAPPAPIRVMSGEAAGLPRPADCPLEILYKAPDRPHVALGHLVEHVMAPPPGGAVEALRPRGCALGADAVIVTRNQVLNLLDQALVEGTAIRYLLVPAAPPAQQGAPPTQ
jgi:hypothetical protein